MNKKTVRIIKRKKTSSIKWLKRHTSDRFVKMARVENYRSRAAYKLIEIQDKFKIFNKNSNVLDLGSSPGGWSQVVAKYVTCGKIIAVDKINMRPIKNVEFMQSELTSEIEDIKRHLSNIKFNVILSDIAPNTSGNFGIDVIRLMEINKSVILISQECLSEDGLMVLKIFRGTGEEDFVKYLGGQFGLVKYFKPSASRKESREIYLIIYKKITS